MFQGRDRAPPSRGSARKPTLVEGQSGLPAFGERPTLVLYDQHPGEDQ